MSYPLFDRIRAETYRKLFRNSLESLDQFPCPDEYVARSKYSLAQLLKLRHDPNHEEVRELEADARKLRDGLLHQDAPNFDRGSMDDLGVFDYMVSYKAGRTTICQAPVRLFDVSEIEIDESIAAFGEHDIRLHDPSSQKDQSDQEATRLPTFHCSSPG